jgi:choice-of-anchor A domain-containing protein
MLASPAGHAIPALPDLGIAGRFNAFILEDMHGWHSDVEGRLAVGGNLSLEHYSIGLQLPDSRGGRDDLIVGGDATFQHGRLYSGNAVVGGHNGIHPENVGFYNGDDPSTVSGSVRQGAPLDFDLIGADLRKKSGQWGSWEATGGTSINEYGELRFTGSGSGSVFSVNAADLNAASSLWFDMPSHTNAVINVFGDDIELSEFGFFHTALPETCDHGQHPWECQQMPDNRPGEFRHSGWLTNRVLFNFVHATSLSLNAIGFKGSLLAPLADVSFYNGHIDGNFISRSVTAPAGEFSGQFNAYAFGQVPAPATLASLILGLLALGANRRSRAG